MKTNYQRLTLLAVRVLNFIRKRGKTCGIEILRSTDLSTGTLYPMLHRLHSLKLLDLEIESSSYKQAGGHAPRMNYTITQEGLQFLDKIINELRV